MAQMIPLQTKITRHEYIQLYRTNTKCLSVNGFINYITWYPNLISDGTAPERFV